MDAMDEVADGQTAAARPTEQQLSAAIDSASFSALAAKHQRLFYLSRKLLV